MQRPPSAVPTASLRTRPPEHERRQQHHLAATAEKLVHEADGDSTVPDPGRDALDRAAAYIAGGEHTGKARLQQHG